MFDKNNQSNLLKNNPVFLDIVEELEKELFLDDYRITTNGELTRNEKMDRREDNANLRAALHSIVKRINSKAIAVEK